MPGWWHVGRGDFTYLARLTHTSIPSLDTTEPRATMPERALRDVEGVSVR